MVEHIPDCKYYTRGGAVACNDPVKCDKCGWNPLVDMERKQKTRERMAEKARKGEA